MKRVAVKYCGGCNPQIERSGFVDELGKELDGEIHLTVDYGAEEFELGVMVCGCPVACANRPGKRAAVQNWIVVAGAAVDTATMHENKLPEFVALKIREFFQGRDDHHEVA